MLENLWKSSFHRIKWFAIWISLEVMIILGTGCLGEQIPTDLTHFLVFICLLVLFILPVYVVVLVFKLIDYTYFVG